MSSHVGTMGFGPRNSTRLPRANCTLHRGRQHPKDYRFVAELPKTDYGKVLKTALQEQEANHK